MLVKATLAIPNIDDTVLEEVQRCKLAVIGDNNSGKTCLLSSLMDAHLELDQMAIFEECIHNVSVDHKTIEFMLWDLSGQQDYDGLRVELYRDTDIFLVCFDIGNPLSLSNAETMWIPELKEQEPNTPFLLVGCKNDKREFNFECSHCLQDGDTTYHTAVSKTTAERVALSSGAKAYIECCAKTRLNINEVFQTAGEIVAYSNCPMVKNSDHHFSALRTISKYTRRKSADTNDIKQSPLPSTTYRSRRGSVM